MAETRKSAVPKSTVAIGVLGVLLYVIGSYNGLFIAPADRYMGDIQRIMYVHVPSAWVTMVCFTMSLVAALGWVLHVLRRARPAAGSTASGTFQEIVRPWGWDDWLESSVEVGVVFGLLLVVQGMIWAKPTWGVYWTWDPRLTTVAVMELMFVAVLALRGFVEEPIRRATWSAVVTIIAYVNVPLVYFSVRWWSSLHQVQSTAKEVDKAIQMPLAINAVGVLFIGVALMGLRAVVARFAREALMAEADGPDAIPTVQGAVHAAPITTNSGAMS